MGKKAIRFCLSFILLLLIIHCSIAQERLTSRFTYFANDSQCYQYTSFCWQHKLVTKNRAVLNYTTDKQLHYRYTPAFKGLSGNAEVFIYKYSGVKNMDKRVLVEVFHAGKIDSLYVDFNTTKDEWVSLGKFAFKGEGKEFVQFTRIAEEGSQLITPILPIRFDLYYNTKTRPQTTEESATILPLGLSKKGSWKTIGNSGYRSQLASFLSTKKGDEAIWNPGKAMQGKLNIYLYKPNTTSKDVYKVAHNGKVDEIQLPNLMFANLDLYNPVTTQGWYKMGEFDFAGKGNEYVQLQKKANDTSVLDCIMFEKVQLDGTILDRTIVTTAEFSGQLPSSIATISLEEKIAQTKYPVGLSPNNNGESVVTSSKNGSTIYSRALYAREKTPHFIWNPCITEPGDYSLYYYVYHMPNTNGTFEIKANGEQKVTPVTTKQLTVLQQYLVGTYAFKGGSADEIIEMKNLNRASDITLEKNKANGAILQQVVVTAHPYFKEYVFADTKEIPARHDISEMVRRQFVKPLNKNTFGINQPISVKVFVQILKTILDTAEVKYTDVALQHLLTTTALVRTITLEEAAHYLFNALEISGRYANVRNYFKTTPQQILANYSNAKSIQFKEAFARLIEMNVIKVAASKRIESDKKLTRLDAVLLLKEFNEQVLGSGPPPRADWDISFFDEFEGNAIDWNKWIADDVVRFKGVSAKWKENCVVEDGLFKGYNYMDNHLVPYSSGNLNSNFRQTYGFFEARYKYPDKAYGSHSSFWTSSKGGDFNYNEGTYPNSVSNNNYFMKSGTNFHDFATPTNWAHDFHTISGYLNSKDLFYGMDGKITWEVKDYPRFYADKTDPNTPLGKTTDFPYNVMISTVVTYFDGPLDRDRIDGSHMACDWVRVYKEVNWLPKVDTIVGIANNEWAIKFNKPMDSETVKNAITISASNSVVPTYAITEINPMRFKVSVAKQNNAHSTYSLHLNNNAKDSRGNALSSPTFFPLNK